MSPVGLARSCSRLVIVGSFSFYIQNWCSFASVLTANHWFSYLFTELKGPSGSTGEATIQNTIALIISLRIQFHLARLAARADPVAYRRPSTIMRRVYGLQTVEERWKLVMMVAEAGEEPTSADVLAAQGGSSSQTRLAHRASHNSSTDEALHSTWMGLEPIDDGLRDLEVIRYVSHLRSRGHPS